MTDFHIRYLEKALDKITDLEKQLAEKDKQILELQEQSIRDNQIYNEELAEKEKLLSMYPRIEDMYPPQMIKLANQDKISFAVEQLEEVKEKANEKQELDWGMGFRYKDHWDIVMDIDAQIKRLKEGKLYGKDKS